MIYLKGWESNYPHPVYSDVKVLGSALHNTLHKDEEKPMQTLRKRGSHSLFYHSFSCHANHEPLNLAIDLLQKRKTVAETAPEEPAFRVFQDQWFRARALRCLFVTLRNTAVWIYAVHEYMDTQEVALKKNCRVLLDGMMEREIKNCKELLQVWRESPIEWIIISGSVGTPFIHGKNFGDLLERKIDLMQKHKNDEPRIDPDYMFRLP